MKSDAYKIMLLLMGVACAVDRQQAAITTGRPLARHICTRHER